MHTPRVTTCTLEPYQVAYYILYSYIRIKNVGCIYSQTPKTLPRYNEEVGRIDSGTVLYKVLR